LISLTRKPRGHTFVGWPQLSREVGANIPAATFWSVTLYEAENDSGLAKDRPFPSLGSRDKPAQNAAGSTDLYLGPKTPSSLFLKGFSFCYLLGVLLNPKTYFLKVK
jgi:hypothetical protein